MEFEDVKSDKLNERFLKGIHESGLRVYILDKKGFTKKYAIYGADFGSIHNKYIKNNKEIKLPDGIAHFLEHKLFEGEDGIDAFWGFSKTGAAANAFTDFGLTAYLFSCTNAFYENLSHLLGFVNTPYFTIENIQKEIGIITEEIKMYQDDPSWRVFFNTMKSMYHKNSVRIDIAGTPESIKKINTINLYDCYNTFYNPQNMVLVLSGDVNIDDVSRILDDKVKKKNTSEFLKIYDPEPQHIKMHQIIQKMDVSMPIFQLGFKHIIYENDLSNGSELLKTNIIVDLITEILFGKSSEFYLKLYELGLLNHNFESSTNIESTYSFTILGGESKDPRAIQEEICKIIFNTIKNGISTQDLSRVKKTFIGSHLRIYDKLEVLANSFLRNIFKGINIFDVTEAIKSIKEADLMENFTKYFNMENQVLSIIEPY